MLPNKSRKLALQNGISMRDHLYDLKNCSKIIDADNTKRNLKSDPDNVERNLSKLKSRRTQNKAIPPTVRLVKEIISFLYFFFFRYLDRYKEFEINNFYVKLQKLIIN